MTSHIHVCFPDLTPVKDTSDCPNSDLHTPSPDGYDGWHEWANEMTKTHKQKKCPGCGLLAIWEKKK